MECILAVEDLHKEIHKSLPVDQFPKVIDVKNILVRVKESHEEINFEVKGVSKLGTQSLDSPEIFFSAKLDHR